VSGECTTPTPGYTIVLEKAQPQGINPNILILRKVVTRPSGIEPQHLAKVQVSYHEKTDVRFTEVTIIPDNVTIKVENVE
jgi:hypothetical protein